MSTHPLDNPLITSMLFYPRADRPGNSHIAGAIDGSIPVEDGVSLGYRFYAHQPDAPVSRLSWIRVEHGIAAR